MLLLFSGKGSELALREELLTHRPSRQGVGPLPS